VTIVTGRMGDETVILGCWRIGRKRPSKNFHEYSQEVTQTSLFCLFGSVCRFIHAAKEVLEKVQIIVDRFHVAKLYGKAG